MGKTGKYLENVWNLKWALIYFGKKEIMIPNYPSNIMHQQLEVIRLELENFHQRTRPSQIDFYDFFARFRMS